MSACHCSYSGIPETEIYSYVYKRDSFTWHQVKADVSFQMYQSSKLFPLSKGKMIKGKKEENIFKDIPFS